MPDDLYSIWLKVAPGPRPPDHYALLGLPRFCQSQEQIEAAAQRQLDELDRHSLHNDIPRREACHRMMNEVARARIALTNPQKRAAYDLTLDPEHKPKPPAPIPSVPTPPPAPAFVSPPPAAVSSSASAEAAESPKHAAARSNPLVAAAMANPALWIVPLICIALLAVAINHVMRQSPPTTVATAVSPSSKPSAPSISAPIAKVPGTTRGNSTGAVQTRPAPNMAAPPATTGHESSATTAPAVAVVIDKSKLPPPPIDVNLKPIPSADIREKSSKLVDQVYGDDLAAAKTPAEKAALAKKMLGAVGTLGDHDGDRFVLLGRSADLAVEALDMNTAMAAIDAAAREFKIDALKIKARALDVLASNLTPNQDQQALVRQLDGVIDSAIRADRFDIAAYVVHAAQIAAKSVNDPVWLQKAELRQKEVEDAEAEYKKSVAAPLHATN
ncbi:MAG TPA: hypothetical protein VG326_20455 [Tepidisphaeraceae bacterium]|jgi:hypothetical protein|nr:hypothetical protein [Tepidisphaeraceae bacterium]